ncbi:hypothetical protein ACF0H5_007389 [Mactra antiquata]
MMANYLKPVAAILIPNIGGFAGNIYTRPAIKPKTPGEVSWYMALKKPSFNPPNWIFPPVWTGLYCSMGYASYMIWRDGGGFSGDAKLPLACYGASLALNWAWSPLFFGAKKLGWALVDIVGLWGSIVACIVTFHQVNGTAAHLLFPYLGWMANYLKPVAAVLLPNLGGSVGFWFTKNEIRPRKPGQVTWAMTLKKPWFNPPRWLFSPVWTGLYCSMGYASYMVWRDGGGFDGDAKLPLTCYGVSLALNWIWPIIYFNAKKLGWALMTNIGLWGSILASIKTFHEVNPTAAYLLVPYLGWVSFASYINFWLWRNNRDHTD